MKWEVMLPAKVRKQVLGLPDAIRERFRALALEIAADGPVRRAWPNYGKLRGQVDCHHCHLKKGRPTYVAVWKVVDKQIRIVEVNYVGTHEGADYRRLC